MILSPPFLLVVCALIFLATVQSNRAEKKNGWNNLTFAMHGFNSDLYKIIGESNSDKNVLFSPTSIYIALAMLYAGAHGDTMTQLTSALHLENFKSDKGKIYERIKIILQTLASAKDYKLKMAIRLFGERRISFNDEYLKTTEKYFRAKLEKLDFVDDPSGSRSKINRWVAMMTSNKIKELFPEDAITSLTVLALANAVYFNSSWMDKFEKGDTKRQTFYLSKSQKIKVPMMNMFSPEGPGYRYYRSETLACRVLELPYTGGQLSMLIFLPDEVDGLPLLRELLGQNSIAEVIHSSRMSRVRVTLPKFKLQQTLNLKETLQALGMKNLFQHAHLSGIADSDQLVLSNAIHKAYLAVDEDGTEGAAATGVNVELLTWPIYPEQLIYFNVDRPFLFFLVEKATGAILFSGDIKNPLKSY